MREIKSDIEREEIFDDVEIIPIYSTTIYRELFSVTEIFTQPIPPVGVWQWFSGLTVQWESGANVELE